LPYGDVQVNRFPRFTGDQNLLPSSFTSPDTALRDGKDKVLTELSA
jgi:hypothetical protein